MCQQRRSKAGVGKARGWLHPSSTAPSSWVLGFEGVDGCSGAVGISYGLSLGLWKEVSGVFPHLPACQTGAITHTAFASPLQVVTLFAPALFQPSKLLCCADTGPAPLFFIVVYSTYV